MNVKLLAVVVLCVVAVGAIGGYMIISDDGEDNGDVDVKYPNRLMIYGNANGDDYLDDKDLKKVRSIVADQEDGTPWDRAAYPFADANADGKVDQADVDFVKRMVDREHMEIYLLDTDEKVVPIDYPLGNVATISTVTFDPMTILGVQDKVVARHGTISAFDTVRHSYYLSLPVIGKNAGQIECVDMAMFSNVASKVPGGIDAVITRSGFIPEDIENSLKASGTQVIRLGFGSINTEQATILNLGYIMEAEEASHRYVAYLDEVTQAVEDIVASVPEKDRPTILCTGGGGNSILYNGYEDCQWSMKAGAKNNMSMDVVGSPMGKRIQVGDVWQYDSKYDADYLAFTRGIDFTKDIDYYVKSIKDMEPFFGQHDCFPEKTIIMSTQVPSIVGSMYFAQIFYPDKFTENLADKYMQQYVDEFLGIKGFNVSEHPFVVTYEDVKDLL